MHPRKSTPGPRGTACITCRQRRKKCDKTRPICDRCTKGDFECLGYVGYGDHEDDGPVNKHEDERVSSSITLELKSILPRAAGESSFRTRDPPECDTGTNRSLRDIQPPTTNFEPALASWGPIFDPFPQFHDASPRNSRDVLPDHTSTPADDFCAMPYSSSVRSFGDLRPLNQSQSLVRARSPVRKVPTSRDNPWMPPSLSTVVDNLGAIMNILSSSVPRSVGANVSMRESYFTFVMHKYEVSRIRQFFQPPPAGMLQHLVSRTKRSGDMISFMYLGTQIFQALAKTPRNAVVRPYVDWIDKFDRQLTTNPQPNNSIRDVSDRLAGLLELVFLKFVTVNSCAGYSLLCRSLPTFFHVVSFNSSLWSERQGLLVSLPRALAAERYEIRRFVFYDTMTAFVLALPPLVEYDTPEFPMESENAPLEWVHGIPVELIVNITRVNSWRAAYPGIPNINESVELEIRTITWKLKVAEIWGEDSFAFVARLAVQECWRHAVLIYIYMGMGGVTSHDPRVQLSVRQIIQLLGVVSESPLDVHLFIPCVVAGLAAQYESQRAALRDKLASFCNTRVWLCPGSDFTLVLDHLWHGAAREGGAVTWENYVYSRTRVLPIP